MTPLRVLLIGRDDYYLDGLRMVLDHELDLRVEVGPCPHESGVCDVAVAELWDCDPTTMLDDVRRASRYAYVVLVLRSRDPVLADELLRAGATGLVGEWATRDALVHAIREAGAGRRVVDPALLRFERAGDAELTELERQLLGYIAAGFTNVEMAQALHRSVRSVESHRAAVVRKVGSGRRADLVRAAQTLGIAEIERAPRA